ncbi:hypothetical protein [Clostridium ganghwense]|uniref:Uncharacterized protein n=1 Tax=Clostridium ganghwense TaxID=312089 RepID=A0ABT4CRX8_9CLOT|nr:hypothetical protein [Clostridium ganghwense]MCY6370976.1 hypothetical protein [Clostridium ganghwense]
MKVKCVDDYLCSTITKGSEYVVIEEGDNYYVILDNKQQEVVTRKDRYTVVEDNDVVKKIKATINELNHQLENDYEDIKNFNIRKNSKGEIKEVIIKFKY